MYFFKKGAYLFIKNENAKEIFLLFTSLAYIMYAYKRILIFSQVIFQVAIFYNCKHGNTRGCSYLFITYYQA